MNIRRSITLAAAIMAALAASAGNASTVSFDPTPLTVSPVGGTATFGLFMDFTGVTIQGGGVSMNLTGLISLAGTPFTPTAYMQTLINGGFAGFGTANANTGDEFLVYFGAFEGITGANKLGDFTVNLAGLGAATIGMTESTNFPFAALNTGASVPVTVTGADFSVVPAPASAWLLATGVGAIGAWRRRKSSRTPKAQAC